MAARRTETALRKLGRVVLTLGIFGLCGAAIVGGQALIARVNASAPQAEAPLVPVDAMEVLPGPAYSVTRRFTGQIEAAMEAELGFELSGRVVSILVDEGDRVGRGEVLARLDIAALVPERDALEAELAALAADAELARLTLARNDALTENGFRSVAAQDAARLSLSRTEAGMAAIRARIAGVDVRLDKSGLLAPFDAVIGARLVDPGQTVAAGQAALVLYEDAAPRLRVGLPPDLAATLNPGDRLNVEVANRVQPAQVLHIRPDIDPGTRSRSVLLSLPADAGGVMGQTATVVIRSEVAEPGFWAPLPALREGVRGSWSVMALEAGPDGYRVLPAAVEIIHTEGARVYLRGALPEGARIVAMAPDRVAPGQRVAARPIADSEE